VSDEQERELHRLRRFYRNEARRCSRGRGYLAACVMAAAELETSLLLMVNIYPEEATAAGKLPTHKKAVKPLVEWSLAELLRVAKAAGWLPSGLELGDDWNRRRAKVGDYAEVARQVRNLLHPARYMEDHFGKRVTKKHLKLVFETIEAAGSFLLARVETSLQEHMKAEGLLL
jgi:hypothetical protein